MTETTSKPPTVGTLVLSSYCDCLHELWLLLSFFHTDLSCEIELIETQTVPVLYDRATNTIVTGVTNIYSHFAKVYRDHYCTVCFTEEDSTKKIRTTPRTKLVESKAFFLGKPNHAAFSRTMERWLQWYSTNLVPAVLSLKRKSNPQCESVAGFPNLLPEFFILSHSLFKKNYIGWNHLTGIDLLFFPSIHWFIQNIIVQGGKWFFIKKHFLFLHVWFEKIQLSVELEKYREHFSDTLPIIQGIRSHLPEAFQNREALHQEYVSHKPPNLVSDVTHAQPSRKKPLREVFRVLEKFSVKGINLSYSSDEIFPKMDWTKMDFYLNPSSDSREDAPRW
eukprot:TRINITY_DN4944_c0_g2_i10.p1 TRINITY_DN4944_c0_g2~~TRINITY_DN4944_c0_g2_i10.p1  ORF type:complete len:335 (-),score=63.75 TRINITY_DN4944_c0_g2_i10:780-1784(-)